MDDKSTNEIIKLLNISSKLIIKISENIHTIMPGFTFKKCTSCFILTLHACLCGNVFQR